jgi:hypothetical protein
MAPSAGKLALLCFAVRAGAQVTCQGTFERITAQRFASDLNPGWNAGNSLDAIPTETSWGQPLLVNSTFTNVKNHGFKGVRIPGIYRPPTEKLFCVNKENQSHMSTISSPILQIGTLIQTGCKE